MISQLIKSADWKAEKHVSTLPVELARAEFSAHGGEVFTEPVLKATVRLLAPGALHALASCNLHGLWEGALQMTMGM